MSGYLISTPARPTRCRCGSDILRGLDQGIETRVEATPTDPAGEITALLDGRHTYALVAGELAHRTPGRIRAGLVGRGLYVEHRCPTTYVQPTLIGAA